MASALHYGFYPTWYYITYPTVWAKYSVPIIASSYMYNQIPPPENPDRTYAQGSASGYDNVPSFYKEICDKLRFNPFTITTMYMTPEAIADEEMVAVINAFNGTYEARSGHFDGFNPEPSGQGSTSADRVGYVDLDTPNIRGTFGYTGSGFNGVTALSLCRFCHYTQYTSNDGVMLEFDCWPETAIESGTVDCSRLFKDGTQYRILKIQILIYKHNDKYYWSIEIHNNTLNQGLSDFLDSHVDGYDIGHIYNPDNPYDDHQADGNEGGNGGFDHDSDPTPIPDLPSVDITATGGLKLYKCTNADISALFSYLNSHDPGESVLKMWQNPIQAVLACYILPYPVTAAGSASISVLGMDTGVAAFTAKQWQQWSLGSVFVDYSCGNCFLDFEPYSQCSIYLPFIGIRRLNMDEVVGKTVGVTYQFDNTSGACVAYVTVGGSVKYSFSGSCAVGIPLTQQNWGQFYISAATAAAGALAGGIGGAIGAAAQGAGKLGTIGAAAAGAVEGGGGLSSLTAKPTVSRSGSISGAASALAYPAPYLIIEYPEKAKVANPAPVTGLTCGRTLSLGSLSGYNVIEHVHLHGIAATGEELDEIERLLYEGAMF